MATAAGVMAFYYFFASFAVLFRFFSWKSAQRKLGRIISVSGPQAAKTKFSGANQVYLYEVQIGDRIHKFEEGILKGINEPMEVGEEIQLLVKGVNEAVISPADLNRMKKSYFTTLAISAGSFVAMLLFIAIAASI